MVQIAVDGFGGDHAPRSVLEGAALAIAAYDVAITITGDEQILRQTASEHRISLDRITFCHTTDVIQICDDPTSIMNEHKNSSMGLGMRLLKENKASAFVSAGSTGALTVGTTLLVKRLKGIKRVTIAALIPAKEGCYLLTDAGANLSCRPEMLLQFGLMGSIYMNKIMGIANPKVGLLNIGLEPSKGQELQILTHRLLEQSYLNFIGNIEARDLPFGNADVVIADGFTGNVVLKLTEGFGSFLSSVLKSMFLGTIAGKIAATLVRKEIKQFKRKMDYAEYGGAPLLGAAHPVIKAHGSSDAYAMKNAIRQAYEFVKKDVNAQIVQALEECPSLGQTKLENDEA